MTLFKKLFGASMTKEQKAKMKDVTATLKEVKKLVEEHVKSDPRTLELEALELILAIANLEFEKRIQKVFEDFMVTGVLPPGPIGDTIKKQAIGLEKQLTGMVAPARKNYSDVESAEKDFDDDSTMPSKKVVH